MNARARWGLGALGAGTVLVAASSVASAQTSPASTERGVELSWVRGEGGERCATEAEIAGRIVTKLGRDPFVARGDRTLEAIVRRRGDAREVQLFLRDDGGRLLGDRSFDSTDEDCAALEEAAVLAIALLIDPEAALAPPAPTPSPAPPVPPPASAPAGPVFVPVMVPVAVPTAPASPPPQAAKEPRLTAAALVEGVWGPLPRPAIGLGIAVDVEPVRRLHGVASVRWTPEVETDDGDFAFSLVRAELGACGDALATDAWALAGCGGVGAGAMNANTLRLDPVDPGEQPWVELAARARALGSPWGPLVVGLELGVAAVLVRPQFAVADAPDPAFEPPGIAGSAAFWGGVRFP